MLHLTHDQLPFIVNLLLLLLVAKVFGELAERFRQPSMIGEVLAGIILGPTLFNVVNNTADIRGIADLGVFMLIMLAGMEIEAEEIRNTIRGKNLWIALLGFAFPMASGIGIGLAFDYSYTFTLFLGLCIAITALPVSIRILMDLGKLKSDIGQRIISAAIFNDVIALLILGIILDFNNEAGNIREMTLAIILTIVKVGLFTIILYLAYKFFKYAKRRVNMINPRVNAFIRLMRGKESFFAIVILFVLFFSSISEVLGLHFVVGAFFGAILIPRTLISKQDFDRVYRSISGISMGFLAPIFFATMGIAFSLQAIDNYLLLIVVLAASFMSKIAGGYMGGRIAGFSSSKSVTLGIGLNARGIMELVIANVALTKGFIDLSVFSILVFMALLTTFLTPFLLRWGFRQIDRRNGS
jgi:Kef-type K+ transport system membrane component KefB